MPTHRHYLPSDQNELCERIDDQVPSFFLEVSVHDPVFRHGVDIVVVATFINFIIVGIGCYCGVA